MAVSDSLILARAKRVCNKHRGPRETLRPRVTILRKCIFHYPTERDIERSTQRNRVSTLEKVVGGVRAGKGWMYVSMHSVGDPTHPHIIYGAGCLF